MVLDKLVDFHHVCSVDLQTVREAATRKAVHEQPFPAEPFPNPTSMDEPEDPLEATLEATRPICYTMRDTGKCRKGLPMPVFVISQYNPSSICLPCLCPQALNVPIRTISTYLFYFVDSLVFVASFRVLLSPALACHVSRSWRRNTDSHM